MIDGGLSQLFQRHLPIAHWQRIETMTGQGVPDLEFCFPSGVSGWIECKRASTNFLDHPPQPHQIAWLSRRSRLEGRCFVAVRRISSAGPRKGAARDELHLFLGSEAGALARGGITAARSLGAWGGGPASWDWASVENALVS